VAAAHVAETDGRAEEQKPHEWLGTPALRGDAEATQPEQAP